MTGSSTIISDRTISWFLLPGLMALALHTACDRGEALPSGLLGAQPIQFNHKLHVADQGLDCVECHQYVTKNRKATLPGKDVCAGCHSEPQGSSPEEQKLAALLSSSEELKWQRVYVLPEDVYFSHFRHVTLGQIGCQSCHGEMKELTAPPQKPATGIINMSFCLECHKDRRASSDCLACHT